MIDAPQSSAPAIAVSSILLAMALFIGACDGAPETVPDRQVARPSKDGASIVPATEVARGSAADTARRESIVPHVAIESPEFPEIHYSRLAISSRSVLDSVRKTFANTKETVAAYRALITLNRKQLGYFRVGDTIVVPDSIVEDLRAYSVFPRQYPGADTLRKLIVVSNVMQSYACYEYGQLVRFAAANTGTESKPTFPGRYALNWKARMRISSLNENWKLPFTWNFHKYAGNAFHQFEMPGRPVSHSCVRQFKEDAEWLFNWGEGGVLDAEGHPMPMTGTPVIIVGMFDYARKRGGPWLELASNRDGLIDLPESPMGVEEALIPISQIPSKVRGGLPNRLRYKFAEDTLRARGIIRPEAHLAASVDYNLRRAKRAAAAAARRAQSRPEPGPAPDVETTTSPE